MDKLKCFIQLNSSPAYYKLNGFDPKNFESQVQTFKAVNLKSSIGELLQIPGNVVPMFLEVFVLSEKSKYLDIFVSYNKIIG